MKSFAIFEFNKYYFEFWIWTFLQTFEIQNWTESDRLTTWGLAHIFKIWTKVKDFENFNNYRYYFNFEKDLFEKYYYIWSHIIISESLGNDKHYLEILKLDLFVKFNDVLGHIVITKSLGKNIILWTVVL